MEKGDREYLLDSLRRAATDPSDILIEADDYSGIEILKREMNG